MERVFDFFSLVIAILGGYYLSLEKAHYFKDFLIVVFVLGGLRILVTPKGNEYFGKFIHGLYQIPQNIYIKIWIWYPSKKFKYDVKHFFEKITNEENKQLEPDISLLALIIHIDKNYNEINIKTENWQPIAKKLRSGELKCWGKLVRSSRPTQWVRDIGGEIPIPKELWKIRELSIVAKYSTVEWLFKPYYPFTVSSPDSNGRVRSPQITNIRVNESQIKKIWPKNWDNLNWQQIFVNELKEKGWVEKELTKTAEIIAQLGGQNPPS